MKTLQTISCPIQTRYIGPTDFRGSRVRAFAPSDSASDTRPLDSITVGWNDSLGSEENHTAAAMALAKKMQLGALTNPRAALVRTWCDCRGNLYAFVLTD